MKKTKLNLYCAKMVPENKAFFITVKIGTFPLSTISPMHEWLNSEIGYGNWSRYHLDITHNTERFNFRYEEDKVKFILKWL